MVTSIPRLAGRAALALCLAAGAVALYPPSVAQAAGETVNVWLTTSADDPNNTMNDDGRRVVRGLEQQSPVNFAASSPAATNTITVNENAGVYQRFEGAGASITDSTAYLLRGGPVSAATRDDAMKKLFSPTEGIGLSFVRNPIGASDLSRPDPGSVSLDDTCCDLSDFGTNGYDTDVELLTKQAKDLNPQLRVKVVPWSAPAWMKSSNKMNFDGNGWLKSEYYDLYADYFVKTIKAYADRGVKVDYVSLQNEPYCGWCSHDYPGMSWNSDGMAALTKKVYAAFRNASPAITTKVLIHDFNYGQWNPALLEDSAILNDPLFGGIAWHGYNGSPATGTDVHNQYPRVPQFSTEHSGGTWVANQHNTDMWDIVNYTRNWSQSIVKWSLALNQNMGPHNGGCDKCTGLITVQEGGARAGQVDYTIEYYTTGHLTKFVKPGAYRIDSTDSQTVQNVAYRNPDGSKALIAHNPGTTDQSVKVVWGGQSFTYTLPARTTATFTWSGAQSTPTGQITGLNGKCLDVTGWSTQNGNPIEIWGCTGGDNQKWTRGREDGTIRAMGKCLDVNGGGTDDGTKVQLWDCHGGPNQQWVWTSAGELVNPQSGKCLDVPGGNSNDGTKLPLWTCNGGANQKWNLPS